MTDEHIKQIALECAKDIPVIEREKDSGFTYVIADAAAIAICTKFLAAVDAERSKEEPVAWLSTDCIGERYLCFSKPKDNDPVQELYPHPAPPVCKSQIKRLYVQMCGEGFPETDNVIREDREFLAHYSASLDAFFELDREASILIGGTRIHDRGEAAMKEFFAEGGEAEKMISGLDVIPTTMIVKQDRAPEGYVLVPINPAKDALKKCEAMVKMQQMYCSPEDLYAMFIEAAKEKP